MNILWLGLNCFKISEKIDGKEVTVVTDPFDKQTGLFAPKLKADIVSISKQDSAFINSEKITGNLDDQVIILDRPGEYEIKKVRVFGLACFAGEQPATAQNQNLIYKFDINNIKIAHLGMLEKPLTENQLDELGEVDILLIPVGNKTTISAAKAAELVREIEPRVVIPMHYKIAQVKIDIDDENKFLKEMGGKAEKVAKLKISRKDFLEDRTQVIILEKT